MFHLFCLFKSSLLIDPDHLWKKGEVQAEKDLGAGGQAT